MSGIESRGTTERHFSHAFGTSEFLERNANFLSQEQVTTFRSYLRTADISEINRFVDDMVLAVQGDEPISSHALLQGVSDLMRVSETEHFRIPHETVDLARQAVKSEDQQTSMMGTKALIFLYSGSLLSGINRFLTNDPDENDNLCQAATEEVIFELRGNTKIRVSQLVYTASEKGAMKYVKEKEGIPIEWQKSRRFADIKKAVFTGLAKLKPGDRLEDLAIDISSDLHLSFDDLLLYLQRRVFVNQSTPLELESGSYDDNSFHIVFDRQRSEIVRHAISGLSPMKARVLELRFGLNDGLTRTLQRVSERMGVRKHVATGNEISALRRLRNKSGSNGLRELTDLGSTLPQAIKSSGDPQSIGPEDSLNRSKRADTFLLLQRESDQMEQRINSSSRWIEWEKNHPLPPNYTIDDEIKRYEEFKGNHPDELR